jgi:hypothetical protein
LVGFEYYISRFPYLGDDDLKFKMTSKPSARKALETWDFIWTSLTKNHQQNEFATCKAVSEPFSTSHED